MISTIAFGLLVAVATDTEAGRTARDAQEIEGVIAQATQAHKHLMRGDIDAYRRAIRVASDLVLMDPFGGVRTSAPRSEAHWQRIGRFFRDGRDADFRVLASFRSGDLIVLVANEHAHVAVGALPAQDWALRVTLVFRRDADAWRLVHRHADPLAEAISVQEAGRIALRQPADAAGR